MAEFKEAGKDYDKNKIGQYFSAISNEAITTDSENQQRSSWILVKDLNK